MPKRKMKCIFTEFRIFYEYAIRMLSLSRTGKPEIHWFPREENLKAKTLRAAREEFTKLKNKVQEEGRRSKERKARNFQLLRTKVVQ